MLVSRTGFDAVVLGDGTVLVVGDDYACHPGPAESGSESAERYDPVGDAWTKVPSLNKARKEPATVAMWDGSALVLGGLNETDMPFSSTKQFEPESGTWTDGPLMEFGRATPLAATLPDGRVLVMSNTNSSDDRVTSEILDPATGSWVTSAALPPLNGLEDLVALSGGKVLAVGIYYGDSDPTPAAFVFDPAGETWTSVQGLAQASYSLVALPDGTALAIGGADGGELWGGTGELTDRVHRFDPDTGGWTPVTSIGTPLESPQVTVLPDGRVLVAGGLTGGGGKALRTTEIYDPKADRWVSGSDLLEARYGGHAVVLPDGSILVFGGANDFNTEGDTPWCPTPLVTTERLSFGV